MRTIVWLAIGWLASPLAFWMLFAAVTAVTRWVHAHSHRCRVCGLPRFFIRRDHTKCLLYSLENLRRREVTRLDDWRPRRAS